MQPDGRALDLPALPDRVAEVLATLTAAGHEAVLVGGCIRDRLLGQAVAPGDWDAATSAQPEAVAVLFPDATWRNPYGTVTVHGDPTVEVTSYRAEGGYRDARRPDRVAFGVSLEADLARRDFTVNAIAWLPVDLAARRGRLVDPFGGQADLEARVLRAVGDPEERFGEDALRLVRAARIAARLDLAIDPATEAAIRTLAPAAASVSGERLRDELLRILAAPRAPSRGLRLMERLGLLTVTLPELAALRGVPQGKAVPGDALDHTLATVDAVPDGAHPDGRLTALLHDLGKAETLADGHFIGHDEVGAARADAVLRRLHVPRARAERVVAVIAQHMYGYEPGWTDAAVRRFLRRLAGVDLDLLFTLRRADDLASGDPDGVGAARQDELERRIEAERRRVPGVRGGAALAVDGDDLQRAVGIAPGPELGRLLDHLLDRVLEDPARNDRDELLTEARAWLARR